MGIPQVMLRKIDGEEILRRVEAHGVTVFCAAPTVISAILDAAEARRGRGEALPGAGTVRALVAGSPPPSAVIERFESLLGWQFNQLYGLTETSPLLTINRCAPRVGRARCARARAAAEPRRHAGRRRAADGSTSRASCWRAPTTSSRATGSGRT